MRHVPEAHPVEINTTESTSSADEAAGAAISFNKGQRIKITDGPFTEFVGVIIEVDHHAGGIVVLIHMFGRGTPVRVSFQQVKKL
jgi:transcriptional antiterminator NusG